MIESVIKLNHKSDWETPKKVFEYIEKVYLGSKFNLDLCATKHNAKCKRFITPEMNLFDFRPVETDVCFMNPPYTKKSKKTKNPIEDFISIAKIYRDNFNCTVAVLVFSNISGTLYFQRWVGETELDRRRNNTELYFYPQRIKFLENGKLVGVPAFSSMVIIFRSKK